MQCKTYNKIEQNSIIDYIGLHCFAPYQHMIKVIMKNRKQPNFKISHSTANNKSQCFAGEDIASVVLYLSYR